MGGIPRNPKVGYSTFACVSHNNSIRFILKLLLLNVCEIIISRNGRPTHQASPMSFLAFKYSCILVKDRISSICWVPAFHTTWKADLLETALWFGFLLTLGSRNKYLLNSQTFSFVTWFRRPKLSSQLFLSLQLPSPWQFSSEVIQNGTKIEKQIEQQISRQTELNARFH